MLEKRKNRRHLFLCCNREIRFGKMKNENDKMIHLQDKTIMKNKYQVDGLLSDVEKVICFKITFFFPLLQNVTKQNAFISKIKTK